MTLLQNFKRDISRSLNPDHFKLKKFQNKIEINIEVGNYAIKTATTKQEVIASLQLRHLVFIEEFIGKKHPTGLDIDRYDTFFDHLVVIDKKSDTVIATYRMISSLFSEDFYSRSEFNLSDLAKMQGPFLEVGRACVHPDHRRSIVLNLLWRGISEYLNQSGCRVLMGCGSIKTESPAEAALLTTYFKKMGYVDESCTFTPLVNYTMPGFEEALAKISAIDEKRALELIPPLFLSYLKAGAIVGKVPALDREFKCIDYLIILDKNKMDEMFGKRFRIVKNPEN